MNMFLQQLVTGISIGSVYTLLVIGYALVFSVFNFSNFNFGPIMVSGVFAAFYAIPALNLPLFPSVLLAMVVTGIVSFIMESTIYRPMRQEKTLKLYLMIAGLEIDTFVPNTTIRIFGGGVYAFPSGWARVTIQMGDVTVSRSDILAAVLSILMLAGLWMFLYDTHMGLGIRASSSDANTASLMGVNISFVAMIVFLLSGAVTGLADCFYDMKYSVFPSMGATANKGFVAAVIGDLGSLTGAVISSLLLRFLETMIAGYVPSVYRDLIAYTMLVIVLISMPNGTLGKGVYDKIQGVKMWDIQKALPLVHVLTLCVSAVWSSWGYREVDGPEQGQT